MLHISRYHKLGFTGLMKDDSRGEWCCWEDVKLLLDDNSCEVTKDLFNKHLKYRRGCTTRFYTLLIINVLLIGLLIS